MNVLDRKLFRDLWSLRSQVLALVLLVGSGVAVFEMSASNYLTLRSMQAQHYAQERFGDLFVSLKRAPLHLARSLEGINGVSVVDERVTYPVRVNRADDAMAVGDQIISLPATGQPKLNRLRLVKGRWIDSLKPDEVMINEAYAQARSVSPGDTLQVILNGRIHAFRVSGIVLSPEFVFSSRSGLPLPDDRYSVVIWATRTAIVAALDMEGSFNSAVIRLGPGSHREAVIAEIDRQTARYGGTGTIARRDHPSHRLIEDELAEQRTMSIVLPLVFLGIASFLLNIVIGRLVAAQREQIASLKALGYPNAPIMFHYLKLVGVITCGGIVFGGALGAWLGLQMIELYRPFFRFPEWTFEFRPWLPLAAGAIAMFAAFLGAFNVVRRVVSLPAANAMRPEIPTIGSWGALGWFRYSGPRTRMVFRTLAGRPIRAVFTIVGLALALPLVTMGIFWWDALAYMVEFNFERVERADANITFTQPVSDRVVRRLAGFPGVLISEGQRIVPVRISVANRSYRVALQGLPQNGVLKIPRDGRLNPVAVPANGIALSRRLAERLEVVAGQDVRLEVLERNRPQFVIQVVGLADDILGLTAYMERASLNRHLREGSVVNSAALLLDAPLAGQLWQKLKEYPKVEAISSKASLLRVFDERISGLIILSAIMLTGFGVLIAAGVVYNAARVSFHERAWELASLRILGFSRVEVSLILFAELAFVVAISVPLGLVFANWLIQIILQVRENESFHLPAVISATTYAISASVVIVAAIASAARVRVLVDKIDLVSVLKTRD